ncbi:phosphotransferase family protein [Sphingopyxis macrogoltabida]|uniref:phosphotransferase family protein n=1 Tax=Sphingopyxis macrogoltabida TaxID=33050 RepID=UPI0006CA7AEF|nr:phosphotransferase [Sphingopyxis macrogoltabida]
MGDHDAPRLLDRHDDIDPEWLTRVLRAAGHRDANVISFEARPIGAGNVSETLCVDLAFAAPTSAPASVVCKFRSSDETSHAHGIGSGSYLRELESYRLLKGRDDVCRIPAVLWVDGHAENINLVMEDLSSTARAGNQIDGCELDDARSVVAELAKLHRSFYPMERGEAPGWGMTMAGTADYWSAAVDRGLAVIRRDAADRLSGPEMDTVAAAAASARGWYRLPMDRGTLTHGDPRVDNILFGPSGAVLIDWQITGWRNPMHDVGYFLSGSVKVESRRLSEHELLRLYADIFGSGYERKLIERDYRLQLLSGLMTTVAAYGLLASSPEVDRLLITLLRRNAAAAADWDSVGAFSP